MFRTSLSVGGVALVLVGFAGCGSTPRDFSRTAAGSGGTAGKSETSQGGLGGHGEAGESGAQNGGSAGVDAQAGEGGVADDAGSGGIAGDSSVDRVLEIAQPTLAAGKTYAAFTGKISASGAAQYSWSIKSGALPAGLSLEGAQSASVTITGIPTEAGQFPLSLSVTDGSTTKAVAVTLVITHTALFLSDRNVTGVNELFVAEIGADSAAAPVRLSSTFPSGGGVSKYAWSPDGSKVLYLATQSSGGAAELWVASLAAPGTAQRVSEPGIAVGQMAWLSSGNIATYSTAGGDTYMVDLSAASATQSRLALAGHGTPSYLTVSPNGRSVGVSVSNEEIHAAELNYVTWAFPANPKVVPLLTAQGGFQGFSYDGRYVVLTIGPSAQWFDLSLAAPKGNDINSALGVGVAWSPNAQSIFLVTGVPGSPSTYDFSRGDFLTTGLAVTKLASRSDCGGGTVRWSPDGKNGLFGCAADVRGIGNLPTAVAGMDFSLLPSGFLSSSFTDVPAMGWSPDSKWVAVRADRDANAQFDLQLIRWSTPGVAYKPHANSIAQGVGVWAFAQNSQAVAFVGAISPQSNSGLYVSKLPATGAPSTATLVSAPANAVVQNDVSWLPGSHVIAYRATVSGSAQLFALPIAADGTAGSVVSISGASGSGVSSYQLAPAH